MCDYSLENVASRPAVVADRLITTTFCNTITRGFASIGDVNTAVCLRPGTEIAFDGAVEYEHPTTHRPTLITATTARFRQVDVEIAHTHHDVLEFATGELIPLTRLSPGQRATVLQLPSVPLRTPAKADEEPADVLV